MTAAQKARLVDAHKKIGRRFLKNPCRATLLEYAESFGALAHCDIVGDETPVKTLIDCAKSNDLGEDVAQEAVRTFQEYEEKLSPAQEKQIETGTEVTPAPLDVAPLSFFETQIKTMAARRWFAAALVTVGLCFLTAKMKIGKTSLLVQLADAIAKGALFLGRFATSAAKVLLVSFELDELDLHHRFAGAPEPLSANAFVAYSWSNGQKGIDDAERAIVEHGFNVIIFDSFLPLLPPADSFEINSYGDTEFFRKWRAMAKRNNAAIIGSWHEGKMTREDFFLNSIGSVGMNGQADSVLSLDRKRGAMTGKLFVGGNHAPEASYSLIFRDGRWSMGEGATDEQAFLPPEEEKALAVLVRYKDGITPAKLGVELNKTDNASRQLLNRLIAREKVKKLKRGTYVIA